MNTKRRCKPETDDRIYEFHIPGRTTLIPGTEVSIQGKRGRYRFRYARKTSQGKDELTFVGGRLDGQGEKFVSVYPERVARVHRTGKTLVSITKEKSGK
ncbi:DUF7246 family protein [Mycolicibacterium palauense]|uniref:DUF7246 family protein n=1 Tax=Mycolicibacterium palauense TaxID=2034511 RepID=UPI001C3F20B3|nr:hypothetical protein [Mycolicibacterium palauense]